MVEISANDKVLALFNYITEFTNLRQKTVRHIDSQFWKKPLSDIPQGTKYITINDRTPSTAHEFDDVILEIYKPELKPCPEPDEILLDWLADGWDSPHKEATFHEIRGKGSNEFAEEQSSFFDSEKASEHDSSLSYVEHFNDDESRANAYAVWKTARDIWASEQRELLKIRDLFTALYKLHITLERDSDSRELLVGCGILTDSLDEDLKHPILFKRIQTKFDTLKNTIQFLDTQTSPELYTPLLTSIESFNLGSIPHFSEQLSINAYHPLNKDDVPVFLQQLLHSLSSDSQYVTDETTNLTERFRLSFDPIFFVRSRSEGTAKAIGAIISDIKKNEKVPSHILNLVGEGHIQVEEDSSEKSLSEQLAEVGGEDTDILLTKPANKEQLEIARRISKYDAVLVQGPPGTGKTHTIANLLGHFLSEGKTVLVTSHTKKALSVVKEKVEEDLQDLCVTVLDDNNRDMEKAVDGISDMISRNNTGSLKEKISNSESERREIISCLAKVRQKIFDIQSSEFSPIVIGGKSVSPLEAAKFVHDHPEYDIIPGRVELYRLLPLTFDELQQLYITSTDISEIEEKELSAELPNPSFSISPNDFKTLVSEATNLTEESKVSCEQAGFNYIKSPEGFPVICGNNRISITRPSSDGLDTLEKLLHDAEPLQTWIIYAAVAGKKGGVYLTPWKKLIDRIEKTVKFSDSIYEELFGKRIVFSENSNHEALIKTVGDILSVLENKSKLGKLDYLFHGDFKTVVDSITINGKAPETRDDFSAIYDILKLQNMRKGCAAYWDELLACHGVTAFESLNENNPEVLAAKMIPTIEKYINWHHSYFPVFLTILDNLGIAHEDVFSVDTLKTDVEEMQQVLFSTNQIFPLICKVTKNYLRLQEIYSCFAEACAPFQEMQQRSSLCQELYYCIEARDPVRYEKAYFNLKSLYEKYSILSIRTELLNKLHDVAPDWANSIKCRSFHFVDGHVPENIEQIWLWKQYSEILKSLTKESLSNYQSESLQLSHEYRKKTAELAKWRSWYHLKMRIEGDLQLKSSLQSWRLNTKRLGKARKMSAIYRQEAQNEMVKCQEAVPVWIMPMSRALETFTPGKNTFDVVIVDEASQSSISALAITYMAKKVIIVGDDKQVSPTGVGLDVDKMINLAEGMIKDIIPSWSLYTGNSSLYDIVSTVYPALMLREHFRCVPDIIGYSNKLSYDFKIKPLRDTSGCTILPPVVNYRTNGHRDGKNKRNEIEAKTIVALIKACIEDDAYKDKTFGIISLLGDEQPKLIEQYLHDTIDASIIEKRRIIYGSPAQFQGDERDIIFLSLVDSNEKEGPLSLQGYGTDDMFRKRYNVAASRAKDQLWIVHSLDSSRDLKDGDIRKDLIEYAKNPQAFQQQIDEIIHHSESPFEEQVCKSLAAKGYQFAQQWPVGSYRLDIVVSEGKNKVAVECDGDRWHSSDSQVRNDMERQTILERLGWRFIRIRGSEFFRDSEGTMNRVYSELEKYNIHPCRINTDQLPDTELLERIKKRAETILSTNLSDFNPGSTAIAFEEALASPVSVASNESINEYAKESRITSSENDHFQKAHTLKMPPRHKKVQPTSDSQLDIFALSTQSTKNNETYYSTESTYKDEYDSPLILRAAEEAYTSSSDYSDNEKPIASQVNYKGKNAADNLIRELTENNIEFIDNRKQSGIIWAIHYPSRRDEIESLIKKYGCRYALERRGAIATNNRPAWRIIF